MPRRAGAMAAGVLAAQVSVLAAAAHGQTLADRIAGVDSGTVLLSFAARSGTCGDGRDVIASGRTLFIWPSIESHGRWSGAACVPGPVRVAITKTGGAISGIRTHVGGQWRGGNGNGSVELGTVPAADAAAYFVSLAARLPESLSEDALLPAALADSAAVASAFERLAHDPSRPRKTRKRAISWLGHFDDPRARQALHGLIEGRSVSDELKSEAILALGERGSEDDLGFLQILYRRLASLFLKQRVIESIARMERDAGRRWLLELTLNGREPVELRKQALFWAGQADTPVPELMGVYGRLPTPELKEHLIFVLSQRDDDAATTELIRIAQRDPDRTLRKRAIFWLGQSDDPRAAELLRQIIVQQ